MKIYRIALVIILLTAAAACKPMVYAKSSDDVRFVSNSFAADFSQTYAAAQWALKINGYSLSSDSQSGGTLTSVWMPTTSDSHAIDLFGRRDFGANGGYYQLEVNVSSENGRTRVDVGARLKTLIANLKSTGIEERKVLNEIGNYLRTSEPTISNVGIEE